MKKATLINTIQTQLCNLMLVVLCKYSFKETLSYILQLFNYFRYVTLFLRYPKFTSKGTFKRHKSY